MLAAAREKNAPAEVPPLFLHQSMPRLDLYGTVDAAICCLDSLNYLTDPSGCAAHLPAAAPVHQPPAGCWPSTCGCREPSWPRWTVRCFWTRRRIPTASGAPSIAGGCVPIIWTCSTAGGGRVPGTGSFELHRQRGYSVEQLTQWLEDGGLHRYPHLGRRQAAPPCARGGPGLFYVHSQIKEVI